jgi:ribonucleoside-diphosphate reductase alpha chain
MTKIDQKISGVSIVTEYNKKPEMTLMERPEELTGKTYKLKTPLAEAALYVTINDCDGKPLELFINSKDMKNYQWVVALTRVISAVFRNGGDSSFLIEELKSIYDPHGGYLKRGKYIPSLVAEIGGIIEKHLTGLGLYKKDTSLVEAAVAMVEAKAVPKKEQSSGEPCPKCGEPGMALLDNCLVCVKGCGFSKCG